MVYCGLEQKSVTKISEVEKCKHGKFIDDYVMCIEKDIFFQKVVFQMGLELGNLGGQYNPTGGTQRCSDKEKTFRVLRLPKKVMLTVFWKIK